MSKPSEIEILENRIENLESQFNQFKQSHTPTEASKEFQWTDGLVKDLIYQKFPIREEYWANLQKALDEFKQSHTSTPPKSEEGKDWGEIEKETFQERCNVRPKDKPQESSEQDGDFFVWEDADWVGIAKQAGVNQGINDAAQYLLDQMNIILRSKKEKKFIQMQSFF